MSVYLKKRKDGTSAWYYDFMYNRRRYRGVGGITKTQALRAMEKKRNDVLSEEYDLSKPIGNPKFEDFVPVYLKRREHLKSRKRDRISANHLLNYFKNKVLLSISPADVEDYIAERRKARKAGISNSTINRELACLSRMFTLAVKWGEARKNPVADVDFLKEPPGRTRYLSEEEAQNLLTCSDEHLKPIVMTALNTGMRLGEILGLKWDHVHIKSAIEPFIEVKISKNNKSRCIPLTDDMIDLFDGMEKKVRVMCF